MTTAQLSNLFLLLAGIIIMLAAVPTHSYFFAGLGAAAILAGRLAQSPNPTR